MKKEEKSARLKNISFSWKYKKKFITHVQVEVDQDCKNIAELGIHQKQVVYRQTLGFGFTAHPTARGVNRALKGISSTLRDVTLANTSQTQRNALLIYIEANCLKITVLKSL